MIASVILACYNGEKHILEQLESIRLQTRPAEEVIISDDCSTDHSVELIRNFIDRNELKNWTLVENETNIGWKANFAKLVMMAKEDVIFFSDQDDIWHEDKVERMLQVLESESDIDLLVSDLNVKYMSENTQVYNPESLGKKDYQKLKVKPKWLRIMRPGCVFAVRREFAQECFSKNWRDGIAHDLLLWQYAIVRNRVGYLKAPLIEWRRFESSTTSDKIDSKRSFRIIENEIFLESLELAMQNADISTASVMRGYKLEKIRKEFFKTKSLSQWMRCLFYIDCYPKKRTWPADLLHIKYEHNK